MNVYDLRNEPSFPIASRWFFFRTGGVMCVASHGVECGWRIHKVLPGVEDYFEARARDPDVKDMSLIFLEGRPSDEELSHILARGERPPLGHGMTDDSHEVAFLQKYAPLVLR